MVGPGSGNGTGPSPAVSAPPEVQESSVLGVETRYALEDHTHQSPTIYWPQGAGPNSNVVSNRFGYMTVTTATSGATNLCSYTLGYLGPGLAGDFGTISGGLENEADGECDTVAGGYFNIINPTATALPSNVISGGAYNTITSFNIATIAGGFLNTVENPSDPTYEGAAAFIGGGYQNQVYRSGGVAHGIAARAYMAGQMAFCSGGLQFDTQESSEAQYSKIVISGSTLGGIANESVDLTQWVETGNTLTLQADRAYMICLEVVATRVGSTDQHNWVIGVSARTNGAGAVTIKDQSTTYEYSDAGAALYTITVSASGTEIVVTFATGAGNTHQVNVVCTMRISEVLSVGILGDIMSKTQAQASMFTELRAPNGFESIYQGVSATTPVVLSPRSTGLDQLAEDQLSKLKNAYRTTGAFPIASDGNGISPYLVAGVPVPMLSTVTLLIPGVTPGVATDPPTRYRYALVWRMRTFATAAAGNKPFHGKNSSLGLPDDGSNKFSPMTGGPAWSGTSVDRYPIVAAGDSMDYVQTEPSSTGTLAEEVIFETLTVIDPPSLARPIFPGFYSGQVAYGDVSQGITENPSAASSAVRHVAVTRRAYGDELVVLVYRNAVSEFSLGWDFTPGGADASFLEFYGQGNTRTGQRNAGLFVSTGVAP